MAIVTAQVAAVQKLYVAYFNRPADYAGLDYWTNVAAANNGNTASISAAFAAEAEYKTEYANLSNAAVVSKVYMNLFGRPAEAAGQAYWADLLDRNAITIDQVVAQISAGALTTDAEAYENKVAAATAFTNALDTTAEQTGYSGAQANTAAKAFLSGITTDASLTAATAPAALAASVAAVVKAGTPFTLVGGLAALEAANEAVEDFLGTLDLDDDEETDTTEADVAAELSATAQDVEDEIVAAGGTIDFTSASAGVQAALIADTMEDLEGDLATAEADLEEAQADVEEIDGLSAAIEARTTAEAAATAAATAVVDAGVAQTLAINNLDLRNADIAAADVTISATGTVSLSGVDGIAGNADDVALIVEEDGELVLATDVTETDVPGITGLLEAINANFEAQANEEAADDALFAAQLEVHLLDTSAAEVAARDALVAEMNAAQVGTIEDGIPTAAQVLLQLEIYEEAAAAEGATPGAATAKLDAFNVDLNAFMALDTDANNPLSAAVVTNAGLVEDAQEAVQGMAEAVAAYEEAQANVDTLAALNATVTAAEDAFGENDFREPVTLGATAVGTAGADIYMLGAGNSTISSFGRVGADALYIGTEHTLNTGAITTGNNAVLEVFFIQSGANTQVRLETEVYGSDSAAVAEQVITLTGVDAADLQLVNGIITIKGEGA